MLKVFDVPKCNPAKLNSMEMLAKLDEIRQRCKVAILVVGSKVQMCHHSSVDPKAAVVQLQSLAGISVVESKRAGTIHKVQYEYLKKKFRQPHWTVKGEVNDVNIAVLFFPPHVLCEREWVYKSYT
jgi:hypothetical protein